MAFKLPENVQETSTTTGTGAKTLAGAVPGAFSFASQLSNGDTFFAVVTDGTDHEAGIASYNSGANSISFSSFFFTTNGGAAVNWTSGTRDVLVALPGGAIKGLLDPAGGTGIMVQTGSGTYVRRALVVGNGLTVVDGDGIAGDPTLNVKYGKQTLWIPAAAMTPTITSGCDVLQTIELTTTQPNMSVLDFDGAGTAKEYAQFSVAFPRSWNLGTVTARFFWTVSAAVTTGVVWGLQGVAVSDNEAIAASYGTAAEVTDNGQSNSNELLVSAESGAITIAGTPADEDICFFRVYRDPNNASDTMSQDARLIGIQLFFTTDAMTDA